MVVGSVMMMTVTLMMMFPVMPLILIAGFTLINIIIDITFFILCR